MNTSVRNIKGLRNMPCGLTQNDKIQEVVNYYFIKHSVYPTNKYLVHLTG